MPAHLVEYHESGVLRRFQASGVPKGAVLLSQAAVAMVVATVGCGLLVSAALTFTGATPPANLGLLLGAYLLAALAVIAMCLLLGVLLPTARAAQSVGLLAWFVSLFVSGGGPPPEVLPEGLRTVGEWWPLTPVIRTLQEPWLTGELATRDSLVTLGLAAAALSLAWLAYRWD